MDSRILEIVFCLMDYAQETEDQMEDISEYSSNLRGLGYTEYEISTAYNWILNHIGSPIESLYSVFPEGAGTCRVLTELERARGNIEGMFRAAGRDPAAFTVTAWDAPPDREQNRRYIEAGADRVVHIVITGEEAATLAELERLAERVL